MFLIGFIVGFIVCLLILFLIAWLLCRESRKEEAADEGENTEYPEPKCWNCNYREKTESFWRCDQCVNGSLWEPDDGEASS